MTTIDSLQVVQEFVSNAKATLDSLNRFEFTKARYSNLLNQYALEKQVQLALLVRKEELERQNKQLQTDLTKTQFERDEYRKKKNWKGLENWIWRAAAAALIYSQVRK